MVCCGRVALVMMVIVAGWTSPGAAAERINIALHAQSNYATHGWVAGGSAGRFGARTHVLSRYLFFASVSVGSFLSSQDIDLLKTNLVKHEDNFMARLSMVGRS